MSVVAVYTVLQGLQRHPNDRHGSDSGRQTRPELESSRTRLGSVTEGEVQDEQAYPKDVDAVYNVLKLQQWRYNRLKSSSSAG